LTVRRIVTTFQRRPFWTIWWRVKRFIRWWRYW
jgi:hypothetical protein